MKLSDYQIAKFVKAVLSGQPGRGKTAAGLTFPTPMLIFDFDNKMSGPVLYAKSLGIDLTQIEVETVQDWKNWDILAKRLMKFRENPDKFKSFGIDSLTTMADYLLGYTSDKKLLADDKAVKRVGGIQVAGIDEYNAETSGIMDFLLFMKDVQANVWLTAHVLETRTENIESRKITVNRSLLTGGKKIAAKIPAYFPENYSFNIEPPIESGGQTKFVCYTQSNSEDYARTEFQIPPKLDFTGKPFYTVLRSEIDKATL